MSAQQNPVLWQPSQERLAAANLTAFSNRYRPHADYWQLHDWSLSDPNGFWRALWEFTGLQGKAGKDFWRDYDDMGKARFMPDAKFNYAENMLRGPDSRVALVFVGEDGRREQWSVGELRSEVGALQQALSEAGVAKGDRVAGLVSHTPQALAAMLATVGLGAIWSSCSPDFGAAATLDRLAQVNPKVLFATAGYFYAGKSIDSRANLATIASEIESLSAVVVAGYAVAPTGLQGIKNAVSWESFRSRGDGAKPRFVPMPACAPGFILFSSGTTGKPKCIVHSAAGILLKLASEIVLHADLRQGDRLFYFTTCGWMMWNWQVSALAFGVTLVMYDGNPVWPGPSRLLDLAASEGVTHFGASAKYFDLCRKEKVAIKNKQTAPLRTLLSTGSPLFPENFDYLYESWGSDLHLAPISGGTDICGCFLLGVPILPVRRGEMQAAALGCDMAVYDQDGKSVQGDYGELVCRKAVPSMPLGFWGDDDGQRYHEAYFSTYPKVWRHGDWALATASGGWQISGRSDSTLNPQGVRIGTAEIYRQVESLEEVQESVAVGQEWDNDVRILLFVVMRGDHKLDDGLQAKIRAAIRTGASPRHVPAKILAVTDIPRTRSGKLAEMAIRATIHGRPVPARMALANPQSLQQYANLEELGT